MAALEHRATGHTEHTDETRRLIDDYEPEAGSTDQAEPVIRAIAAYRCGERPLAVPIARLWYYLRGHPGSRLRDPTRL